MILTNKVILKRNRKCYNGNDMNHTINDNLAILSTDWINSDVQEHWYCLKQYDKYVKGHIIVRLSFLVSVPTGDKKYL